VNPVNRVMMAFNVPDTGHWFGMRPNGWSLNCWEELDDGREVSEAQPLHPGVDGCSVAKNGVMAALRQASGVWGMSSPAIATGR
jgi:hypothetical protein